MCYSNCSDLLSILRGMFVSSILFDDIAWRHQESVASVGFQLRFKLLVVVVVVVVVVVFILLMAIPKLAPIMDLSNVETQLAMFQFAMIIKNHI